MLSYDAYCLAGVLGAAAVQSMLEFLRGICSDVRVVQGDFDDFESPEQLVSSSRCDGCAADAYVMQWAQVVMVQVCSAKMQQVCCHPAPGM
jgi:hypothetical protein